MFTRTPVAKEFCKWVLDILDKEVVGPVHQVTHAAARQNYAVITYFENDLLVACHPLLPGEVVMNPDSCLEHVIGGCNLNHAGQPAIACDAAARVA